MVWKPRLAMYLVEQACHGKELRLDANVSYHPQLGFQSRTRADFQLQSKNCSREMIMLKDKFILEIKMLSCFLLSHILCIIIFTCTGDTAYE